MESYCILILWVGLFALLWGLRNGLADIEASIERNIEQAARTPPKPPVQSFDSPDIVADVIGKYMETPIYQKITIGSVDYYFDRILTPGDCDSLGPNERRVAPGIVYTAGAH